MKWDSGNCWDSRWWNFYSHTYNPLFEKILDLPLQSQVIGEISKTRAPATQAIIILRWGLDIIMWCNAIKRFYRDCDCDKLLGFRDEGKILVSMAGLKIPIGYVPTVEKWPLWEVGHMWRFNCSLKPTAFKRNQTDVISTTTITTKTILLHKSSWSKT